MSHTEPHGLRLPSGFIGHPKKDYCPSAAWAEPTLVYVKAIGRIYSETWSHSTKGYSPSAAVGLCSFSSHSKVGSKLSPQPSRLNSTQLNSTQLARPAG